MEFVHAGREAGAEMVGRLKKAFSDGRVAPVPRLLLDYGMQAMRGRTTSEGNLVLDLRGKAPFGRDDPAVAAAYSIAMGQRLVDRPGITGGLRVVRGA